MDTSGLAGKSHDIGRQVSLLPPSVVSIQSEIENFPYQRLKKAAHITVLEAASHMAAGCTGAAFNVLSGNDEPLRRSSSRWSPASARPRPFFDLMAKHLGRTPLAGIFPAWNKDTAAACDLPGGNWFTFGRFLGEPPGCSRSDCRPPTRPAGAPVTLLSGDSMVAFTKDEIRKMLSGGVLHGCPGAGDARTDGLRDLTGFDGGSRRWPATASSSSPTTRSTARSPGASATAASRSTIWPAHIAQEARPEGRDPRHGWSITAARRWRPATMGVFENRLGGRVCVAGYFPWTFLHSLSKSAQMKSVMRWLSRDRLPAYVASFHKINLWVRDPGGPGIALALTNSCLDPARDVALLIRTDASGSASST